MVTMDDIDRKLLNRLQADFPLDPRPFARLGELLCLPEAEVMGRIQRLKDEHIVRQISAIFDTRALGYLSSLVAMKVEPSRVDEAGYALNSHPGISHNYRRNHEFNLWFTVAVPPTSSLERTVAAMHELAGAQSTRLLPTLRLFKIEVKLDMAGEEEVTARSEPPYAEGKRVEAMQHGLTDEDIAVIRELQEDLSIVAEPFHPMAEGLGMSVSALLERAKALIASGHMRRFAAILYHRDAGFRANPMAVWRVPEERVLQVGPQMASFNAVSHCYQRPVYPDWPYNLFTMIHGRTVADCQKVVQAISETTGITEYALLYSTKEYKKTRVRYFSLEFEEWERRYLKVPARKGGSGG